MRVLLFLLDISRVGGVECVVSNLANLFVKWKGFEVTVLSCFNTNKEPAYQLHESVKTDCLETRMYPGNALRKIRWYLQLAKPLQAYIQEGKYDAVLAEGSYLCATLCLVGRQRAVKIGCEHIGYSSVNIMQKMLRRRLYKRLDKLVVLTENDRKYFASYLPEVLHIPNFITQQPLMKEQVREKIIISAGRLSPQKGFDLLLEAYALVAKKHPDWQLRILGDGEERLKLERLSRKIKIEAYVSMPGQTAQLTEEFARSSIFVMPSRYEGFPMTLLEAMQIGLPCVSFSCSGPDEIIDHDANGLLIKQGDVPALAEAIITLIENAGKREEFAKHARVKAALYSPENIGKKWKNLFQNILVSQHLHE